VYNVPIRL